MIVFITTSKKKINQYKLIFPDENALFDSTINLIENYSIKNRREFLEFKFSEVNENLDSNYIMIEDTIVSPLSGTFPFYNRIGQLIKKMGMKRVIEVLEDYNPIYLESSILLKKGNSTIMVEKKVLGRFKYYDSESNVQLEDFFFIDKSGLERQIRFSEFPRVQCFEEVKSILKTNTRNNII